MTQKKKKSLRDRYEQRRNTTPKKFCLFFITFSFFFQALPDSREENLVWFLLFYFVIFVFFSWLVVDSSQSTKTTGTDTRTASNQILNFVFQFF
jgi:hypothetical protein